MFILETVNFLKVFLKYGSLTHIQKVPRAAQAIFYCALRRLVGFVCICTIHNVENDLYVSVSYGHLKQGVRISNLQGGIFQSVNASFQFHISLSAAFKYEQVR